VKKREGDIKLANCQAGGEKRGKKGKRKVAALPRALRKQGGGGTIQVRRGKPDPGDNQSVRETREGKGERVRKLISEKGNKKLQKKGRGGNGRRAGQGREDFDLNRGGRGKSKSIHILGSGGQGGERGKKRVGVGAVRGTKKKKKRGETEARVTWRKGKGRGEKKIANIEGGGKGGKRVRELVSQKGGGREEEEKRTSAPRLGNKERKV